jgi:hypothetical protein
MLKSWIREAIARGDVSLNERMELIRRAVSDKFNQGPGDYCYAEVYFDDYVIIRKGGKLWRVDLEWAADGTVSLKGEAKQVRIAYPTVQESTKFEGQVLGLLPDDDVKPTAEGTEPVQVKTTGRRWGVLIIQEGMSRNRNRYARKTLQEAAPLYEGASIFTDHLEEPRKFGRSIRDKAGFIKDVRPAVLPSTKEANAEPIFALAATAIITKPAIRQEMLDAFEEGNPNFFGLSHDSMPICHVHR